jgi:DHA1 family tetracycline resistance protein-like MFS transporter
VLLVSIAGAAIDYLIMAFSPFFWVLLVGRIISGITGANMAVATAYIADITPEGERARRFGYVAAGFGVGFIIGPALGGLLGEWWLRAPFLAAAVLNAANFLLACFVLPESRKATTTKLELAALNPLAPLRWAFGFRALIPLIALYFLYNVIGNIPGTIWVLYGQAKFQWDALTVGLSLAVFGLFQALSQAFLTGPLTARLGATRTLIVGMVCDMTAFTLVAFATQGWMAFVLAPLFALGGVGMPALQSLLSNEVDGDKQGELQGVLASVTSLTTIIGPLIGTALYAATYAVWPGTVWIVGVLLYLLMIPILAARLRNRRMMAANG